VAQIINFSILFFIFKKFVSDSMIDLVDERKTLLDRLYKADIYYDEKVKSADTKSEQIIQDAHNQAKQFFDQSKEITSQTIQNLIEKANVEVKYILES
jgi:F0F1-type ATP synthase membrane subunit b/b'